MNFLDLKIITPKKVVLKKIVRSITVPSVTGEITILPRHENLLTPLKEGIIKMITEKNKEEYLAIGGGYLEVDERGVSLLVSRAYGQDEIDEKLTIVAIEKAKKIIAQEADRNKRALARQVLRISKLHLKLKKKHRH